jgi:hypothetical protein
VGRRGRIRAGRRAHVLERRRRLLHGVRHRARRRLRAAALRAEGKEGGAGAGFLKDGSPRERRGLEAENRSSRQIRAAGKPVPVAAVRLLEHAPRQQAHRGRAMAQARAVEKSRVWT